MKFTKLSLIAAISVSAAVAGGDITSIKPAVEAPGTKAASNNNTTINGKLTGYYYTDDAVDLFDMDSSELAFAATLDVTHKFNENIAMNFSAVGFVNTIKRGYEMEGTDNGAYFNVANLTATYADTTFILGRQLLDTPMLGSFDWLLAPSAFEAYTVVNNTFENVTLVGSYVRTWRMNNTGDEWINLTNIDDGNNWTVAAVYDDKTISASLWYYNIDAGATVKPDKYAQIYADAGYNFGSVQAAVQYVNTNYDAADDSDLFAIKVAGELAGFNLIAAYANISDNEAGYIGIDTVYTSSWNTMTSNSVGDAFKVAASTEFSGISATVSYAYYEYEQSTDEGHEFDVILGYNFTDCIDANLVYSNTNYGTPDDVNALEIYANYKF